MEEQRREAMLTLERKEREAKAAKKAKQMAALERKEMAALRKEVSRRKKTEKALVEMRERAERNDRVIQKSEKQGKGGILTRSKTGAPKTAKQTLSKKNKLTQYSAMEFNTRYQSCNLIKVFIYL